MRLPETIGISGVLYFSNVEAVDWALHVSVFVLIVTLAPVLGVFILVSPSLSLSHSL